MRAENPSSQVTSKESVDTPAVVNFVFIPYHPVWSTIIIALDIAIVFALSMSRPRTA